VVDPRSPQTNEPVSGFRGVVTTALTEAPTPAGIFNGIAETFNNITNTVGEWFRSDINSGNLEPDIELKNTNFGGLSENVDTENNSPTFDRPGKPNPNEVGDLEILSNPFKPELPVDGSEVGIETVLPNQLSEDRLRIESVFHDFNTSPRYESSHFEKYITDKVGEVGEVLNTLELNMDVIGSKLTELPPSDPRVTEAVLSYMQAKANYQVAIEQYDKALSLDPSTQYEELYETLVDTTRTVYNTTARDLMRTETEINKYNYNNILEQTEEFKEFDEFNLDQVQLSAESERNLIEDASKLGIEIGPAPEPFKNNERDPSLPPESITPLTQPSETRLGVVGTIGTILNGIQLSLENLVR